MPGKIGDARREGGHLDFESIVPATLDRRHFPSLGAVQRDARADVVRVFEAALELVDARARERERIHDLVDRRDLVEALAGEDVHPDLAVLREGVDGDVALRDEDEARDSPVFRLHPRVLKDVRHRYLRHPDFVRVAVEKVADQLKIAELRGVSAEPIDRNVHSRFLSYPVVSGAECPGRNPVR